MSFGGGEMPPRNNKRELANDEAPIRPQSKRLHVSTARDTTVGPVVFQRKNSKQKILLTSQESGSFVAKHTRSSASKNDGAVVQQQQQQQQQLQVQPNDGTPPQKVICRMNFVQIESVSLEEKTFKVEVYLYCTTRRGDSADGEPEPMSTAFADDHPDHLNFNSSISDEMSPHGGGGGGVWSPSTRPYLARRPQWRPEVLFTLETADLKWENDDEKCVAFSDGTHAWRRHLTMRVASAMQLKSFPFDGQVLTINLTFDACDTIVEVDEDLCEAKLMKDATMLLNDEYHVGTPFYQAELYDPWMSGSMSGKSYWHIKWSIPVIRKTPYYKLNAFMPLFIVVASSWTVFSLPKEEKYPERLSLLVSLLLTLIALKFSLTSMLPKLSYLTMLDLYFMGGYCALSLTILESAIAYTNVCGGLENDGSLFAYLCVLDAAIDDNRFGRLMIVLYIWNFCKPLLLAEYWMWRAKKSYNEGERVFWNPPVSRTWIQWIMKCLESMCVACLFWSEGNPIKLSREAIPICVLLAFQLIQFSLSTIDQSFRE